MNSLTTLREFLDEFFEKRESQRNPLEIFEGILGKFLKESPWELRGGVFLVQNS